MQFYKMIYKTTKENWWQKIKKY